MNFHFSKKNQKLIRCFNYSNIHQVNCKIDKLTFLYTKKDNITLKSLIKVSTLLELITGQRSFFIRSKKSIASLKIRRGVPVGAKVTLRKSFMYSFFFKLI
jgi:large subunit ribosomal protein L5